MRKFSGLNFMYGKKKKATTTEQVKDFLNDAKARVDVAKESWENERELNRKLAKREAEFAARSVQRKARIDLLSQGINPYNKQVQNQQAQIPRQILIFWAAVAMLAALVVLTSAPQRNKPTP